jgi:molybdopterin synthase catalytic subunit
MPIHIREGDFSPYQELALHQEALQSQGIVFGATASFVGTMRDFNEGDAVRRMRLEHYPGMTEKRLEQIAEDARARWRFIDALVVHRVGDILPNSPIVLVAVWSSHRNAAFDACRHILEQLKHSAPFWKKEILAEGERWVERNTEGD